MAWRSAGRMHRGLANIGGVALVLLAVSLSFAATYARDGKHLVAGISTASDVPGTCHYDNDYFENDLSMSELTPPVPCTSPHTSETLWTVELTGILTKQYNRPTPEMLGGQYNNICQDAKRLARYIGQNSTGYPWNITIYNRYPSAPEWRAGVRLVRCVAATYFRLDAIRTTTQFQLRGSWHHPASAAIRLCAAASGTYLPCNRAHVEEVLEPTNPFPASQHAFPSQDLSRQLGLGPCTTAALDLLHRKSLPAGLRVIVEPAEAQNWSHSHNVGCRIASALRTGTLQGGLT